MLASNCELELKQLRKENRILAKKLHRLTADQARLETINTRKEKLLKNVIGELQISQDILEKKSLDLQHALDELTRTQSQLIESEKMAALGNLVAGLAHEINTPIGTSITLASTLCDETANIVRNQAKQALTRLQFEAYLEIAAESTILMLNNLTRAGELVQSFKQVAVDQASLEQRYFQVKSYLEEIVTSLSPKIKRYSHRLTVQGDASIAIISFPGALAQVVTNLLTNSLIHAYPEGQSGHLWLEVTRQANHIAIRYRDDGCGIPDEHLKKVFDPFFTTKRNQGGTGLGLHIVYNLITQNLQGMITVTSQLGKGTEFLIKLPQNLYLKEGVSAMPV